MSRKVVGWIDYESARQLRENKKVAYVKVFLEDPEMYGFQKIEINDGPEEIIIDE